MRMLYALYVHVYVHVHMHGTSMLEMLWACYIHCMCIVQI